MSACLIQFFPIRIFVPFARWQREFSVRVWANVVVVVVASAFSGKNFRMLLLLGSHTAVLCDLVVAAAAEAQQPAIRPGQRATDCSQGGGDHSQTVGNRKQANEGNPKSGSLAGWFHYLCVQQNKLNVGNLGDFVCENSG